MVKVEEWVEFAETSIEGTKKKKTEKQAYYNKKRVIQMLLFGSLEQTGEIIIKEK